MDVAKKSRVITRNKTDKSRGKKRNVALNVRLAGSGSHVVVTDYASRDFERREAYGYGSRARLTKALKRAEFAGVGKETRRSFVASS